MAGSKRRKRAAGTSSATRRTGLKVWEIGVLAAVGLAIAWGGWSWWADKAAEADFVELAAAGTSGLAEVRTQTGGGGHLSPGQSAGYRERFPTSGVHDPKWIDPGVYDVPQPAARLVHSMEHGMVVVFYDNPPPDVLTMLESWADRYGGPWSGVVVTRSPGLGEEIVLGAWQKLLRLDPFDTAVAAAFVDRYRGRGPEHPVR